MANANVNRIGQANGAGAVDALFLKLFGGEVLTAFEIANVALNRTTVKTISSGKSASFPAFGRITAEYHTPGTEITGLTTNQNEVVIAVNDLLISHSFISNIDEAKAHYDARSIYSTEMGRALANQMDKHIFQVGIQAARSSNVVTGLPGGSQILTSTSGAPASADYANNGSHLAAALFLAAAQLDSKNIPEDGRVCFLRPQQYYNLVSSKDAINRDWGGQGAYSDGKIFRVAGIDIVKTNQLPSSDVSTGALNTGLVNGSASNLGVNATGTVGLVMHPMAVATVKLLDLAMESDYDIRRQGTLMVAKYAVGHGVYRPDAAVEIKNAAS